VDKHPTFCISSLCNAVPIMMDERHARDANMAVTFGRRMVDAWCAGVSINKDVSSRMSFKVDKSTIKQHVRQSSCTDPNVSITTHLQFQTACAWRMAATAA
jgi:hypothetical protein